MRNGCMPMLLVGVILACLSTMAMAQVIIHLNESTGPAGQPEAPADTVAAEMKLRTDLGLEAVAPPDPERENPDAKPVTGTINGQILTEDGSPVPNDIQMNYISETDSGGTGSGMTVTGGVFSETIQAGRVTIVVNAPGWATSVAEPFTLKADTTVDDISVVLTRGRSTKVKIVDPAGNPIAGARVNVMSSTPNRYGGAVQEDTGADGVANLPNLPMDPDIRLNIKAPTFQSYVCRLEPEGSEIQTIVLAACRPTVGRITERETGKPIAGAEFYSGSNGDPRERWSQGDNNGKPEAISDAQGHYELKNLDNGEQFSFFVSAPDGRFVNVPMVAPGRTINIAMPAPIIVSGKVTGDLALLRQVELGNLFPGSVGVIPCTNFYNRPEYGGEYGTQLVAIIKEVDGHGEFELKYLMPGRLALNIGDKSLSFDLDKSQTDLEINLNAASPTTHPGDNPEAKTPETINTRRASEEEAGQLATHPSLALPPGMSGSGRAIFGGPSINLPILMPLLAELALPATPPGGASDGTDAEKSNEGTKTLTVTLLPPPGVAEVHGWVRAQIHRRKDGAYIPPQWREVKEGKVTFDVPVESGVQLDYSRLPGVAGPSNQLVLSEKLADQKANASSNGRAFERLEMNGGAKVTVDAEGNYQTSVRLRATGAIKCTITREDGQPVTGNIRLEVQYPSGQNYDGGYRSSGNTTPVESEEGGQFLVSGLPLGVDFTIVLDGNYLGRSLSTIVSPTVRLPVSRPIGELNLVIPSGKTFTVHVVDDKEQPVGGIGVQVLLKTGENRYTGNSGQALRTDGLGRLVIPNVVLDHVESIIVLAGGTDGWQRGIVTVAPDQDEATLKLSPGLRLKGILVDDVSGRPIIGVRLNAQSRSSNSPFGSPNETAITDDQGQFELLSLSLGDIQVYVDNIQLNQGQVLDAAPGQEKPVVVRGVIQPGDTRIHLGDLPKEVSTLGRPAEVSTAAIEKEAADKAAAAKRAGDSAVRDKAAAAKAADEKAAAAKNAATKIEAH